MAEFGFRGNSTGEDTDGQDMNGAIRDNPTRRQGQIVDDTNFTVNERQAEPGAGWETLDSACLHQPYYGCGLII